MFAFCPLSPLIKTRATDTLPCGGTHEPCIIVLQLRHVRNTMSFMKSLTIRLPAALIAEIEAESRGRNISKSDVVRERLQQARPVRAPLEAIADLVGSVDGLPADLSSRTKHYLRSSGYGGKRPR